MKKNSKIFVTLFLIVFCFCMVGFTIYAWYNTQILRLDEINFTSNPEDHLELLMGRVNSNGNHEFTNLQNQTDANGNVLVDENGNPVQKAVGINPIRPEQFDMAEAKYDTYSYYYPTLDENDSKAKPQVSGSYTFDNFTFGVVDNLVEAKPENIVYLRLEIPSGIGADLKFALHYAGDTPVDFYRYVESTEAGKYTLSEWGTDTASLDILNALKQIEIPTGETTPVRSFIQYQYYLTKTAYADAQALEAAIQNAKTSIDSASIKEVEAELVSLEEQLKQLVAQLEAETDETEKEAIQTNIDNKKAEINAKKEVITNSKWSSYINFYQYGFTDLDNNTPNITNTTNTFITEKITDHVIDYDSNTVCYLYIKITPDMDAFAELINNCGTDSRIYIDFDIKMQFEIIDNSVETAGN